jgi:tape measure domain-containing protein
MEGGETRMSGVEERIVSMKFDNRQFESNIQTSINSLDKLKQSLQMNEAAQGLNNLQAGANKFSLATLGNATNGISAKFIALSTVAITALSNITNKAVDAGISLAKSLTIQQVGEGLNLYELKLGSIQTILANTARYGTKLPQVTAALDDLNEYADKTIYNFGEMTKNVGLFTNAGIRIEDATTMIKGFSNEAAASGTNAQGAAAAAYQLSQALSSGQVRLMDWRSLTNVGMGNKNMQASLIELGKSMGTFGKDTEAAKLASTNFNASLEKNWLTTGVMTNYLKIQSGELSKEQMKSLGLTDKQIAKFQKQAKTAEEAATKVRTGTQFFNVLKESIASRWSDVFNVIIGDFNEATNFWTKISETISPMLTGPLTELTKMLKGWKKLGGRDEVIKGLSNALQILKNLLGPIKKAFEKIFPPMTSKQLYNLSVLFKEFTENLKNGAIPVGKILGAVFSVVFTVIKLGIRIVKGILGVFGSLFGAIGGNLDVFTNFADKAQTVADSINKWLNTVGTTIENYYKKISDAIFPVITALKWLGMAFGSLLRGDTENFLYQLQGSFWSLRELTDQWAYGIGNLGESFSNALSKAIDFLKNTGNSAFGPIIGALEGIRQLVDSLFNGKLTAGPFAANNPLMQGVDTLRTAINNIFDKITELSSFKFSIKGVSKTNGDMNKLATTGDTVSEIWSNIVDALKGTGGGIGKALAGIGAPLAALWTKLTEWIKGLDFQEVLAIVNTGFFIALYITLRRFLGSVDKLVRAFSGILNQLTSYLKTMQNDVRANMILKIAIAVGILVLSLMALAKIPTNDLISGIIAIGILVTVLVKAMKQLSDIEPKENSKIVAATTSMILLAFAVRILASAVAKLGAMSAADLAQGLIAVGALLAGLGLFAKFAALDKTSVAAGVSLLLMAVAINILAGAVFILGNLNPEDAARGLGIMAALVAGIVLLLVSLKSMGPGAAGAGVAIALIAGALYLLAGVVVILGNLDAGDTAKGLGVLAALIGGISALLIALSVVGPGALGAGGAILLIAVAIGLLTESLIRLGNMKWDDAASGLGILLALAGVVAVFGAVAAVFSGPLALLGTAILLLGAGFFLVGTGMMLFATALALLAVVGTPATLILVTMFETIIGLIPLFIQQIGLGLIALAVVLRDAGPKITEALDTIIASLIQAIRNNIPAFKEMIKELIAAGIEVLRTNIQEYVDAGYELINSFLDGMKENIPKFVTKIGDLITAFITELDNNNQKIIDAGVELITNLVTGLGDGAYKIVTAAGDTALRFVTELTLYITNNAQKFNDAGKDLVNAIVDGIALGLEDAPAIVKRAAGKLGGALINGVKGVLQSESPSKVFIGIGNDVVTGLSIGLEDNKKLVSTAGVSLADTVVDSTANMSRDVVSKLNEAMSNVGNILSTDVNMSPVITPVIDLTQFRKDASKMDLGVSNTTLSADLSLTKANAISNLAADLQLQELKDKQSPDPKVIQFVQNNNSPESLSTTEIYRRTNNQLSQAKTVIGSAS